jgi:hypothetical protein
MQKRAFSVVGAVFVFALAASSARADSVNANKFIEQLNGAQHHNLDLPDISRADEQAHFSFVLHSNNGKHLGFTAASVHRGPKIGLVKPGPRASVTQNPEPATMILMGTGLVAIGAWVRSRRKV